jgi:hypothetical protein
MNRVSCSLRRGSFRLVPILLFAMLCVPWQSVLRAQVILRPDAAAALIDMNDLTMTAPDHYISGDVSSATTNARALYLRTEHIPALRSAASLIIRAFPLPATGPVDLRVESFSVFTEASRLVEVTPAGEVRRPLPDITFYRGYVRGETGSWVFLAVEPRGISGTITRADGSTYTISTVQTQALRASAAVLNVFENTAETHRFGCGVTEDEEWNAVTRRGFAEAAAPIAGADTLMAGIAIDADFESFKHYGGTDKTSAYITARMAESTAIYERDVNIRLIIPFMRVWGVTDPFQGNSDSKLLDVFGTYWEANMDSVKRTLATMISRKPISGDGVSQGLAWVDVLCSKHRGYNFVKFSGMNTFTTGHTMVLAHEIGHNFGSMHTHSCTWRPPIDSCYTAEPIQGKSPCFSRSDQHLILGGGELMSYCHLSYGNKNTSQVFRDRTGPLIRARAEAANCMDAKGAVYSLDLKTPTGGESVCAGKTITVTWEGSGLNSVAIYLSKNSGTAYDSLLVSGLSRQVKSWDWNIPNAYKPGTTFRFKIKDERNDTLVSIMTKDFEIKQGTFIVNQVTWRNVCVGQGANFNVTASGAGTLTYQWKKNGVDIPGANAPTLQLQNMQTTDDSAKFTCVVTGDCGSVESQPALLKVFSVPKILQQPMNDTLCVGGSVTFTVQADGPELHYKWYTLGKVFDVDSPTYTVSNIQASDANTCYYAEVSSPCGKIRTNSGCIVIPNATYDRFLTPTPYLQLTAGGTFDILWKFYCAQSIKLEYSLDGGQSYTTIDGSLAGDTEHQLWDVPSVETNNGQFRISDANNALRSKISPTFKIKKLPVIAYSDDAIRFGRLPAGALTTKAIAILNQGLGDLQVSRTELIGATASTVKDGAPFTVSPGGSHDVTVETTPAVTGPLDGYMLVEHNAAGSPDTLALVGDVFLFVSTDKVPLPTALALLQNYPNPVSLSTGGVTALTFDLPRAAAVRLTLHNLLGKQISTVFSGMKEGGRHMIRADLSSLPMGTYVYQLSAAGKTISRVLHVIK